MKLCLWILIVVRYMKFINDFNFNAVHEIYMSGFSNISAILNLYRRFFKYIDLPTNSDKTKRAHPLKSRHLPITYLPKNEVAVLILVLNSFRLYGVRTRFCHRQILAGFLDYKYATRPFLL